MILDFSKKILNTQTKSITIASFILGIASFVSAGLGFFRDRLLAGNFGAGDTLDIYYTAFRIPDFISMVFIMGSISAAVIPIFSQYLSNSKEEAFRFLSNLLNLFFIILIGISFLLVIFTPQIIGLIAPGFSQEKQELTYLLTRIMFLSPIILGISNILSSVLRVFRRFLISSLSPILYNVGIIIGILFFYPKLGISGLAWGVVLGALLHLSIQVPILFQVGFRFKKIIDFSDPGFRRVIKLTIPRSIGLAASQANLIVTTAIASTLAAGSIAVYSLADNLSRPFLTLIGNSFSTVAFSFLATSFSKNNKEKFFQIFSSAFSKILIFIMPASILLFLFRDLVVKIILKVGNFGQTDVALTAACLGVLALGLFAQSLTLLTTKAFYAIHNTITPAIASIIGMVANVSLALIFIKLFSFHNIFSGSIISFFGLHGLSENKVIALPLAFVISSIIQFVILQIFFKTKINKDFKNETHS